MRLFTKILLSALALLILTPSAWAQFYQGSNMEFGKNRVQYKDFTWFYYPSKNFDVYYYIGGEPLAEYTLISSERNLTELEKFFDYSLDEKMQILTYLKQSEYRQSNVGLNEGEGYNIGGVARIMGNKMFVYYEGSHALLDKQIRENISRILFNQMMYGGDWKDVLKSSTLLSVPKWYEEGLISYAANGVTNDCETFIKDYLRSGKFRSFNFLDNAQSKLAGQAFWNYISEVYGENVIPNLLYMSQASRNIESGFLYVLGLSLDSVTEDFIRFYKEKSAGNKNELLPGETMPPTSNDKEDIKTWRKSLKQLGDVKVRYRNKYKYTQFKQSPDGKYVSYVTHEMGQYRIWLYDVETQKKHCVLKKEYRLDRIADETFPVTAWHPSSKTLTYVFEKRSNAWLGNYVVEEKKHVEKELFSIQKILDMQYSEDGKKLVFSGVNRGQTDLYLYMVIGNNQEQLTNDIWDDLNPRFVAGGSKVIFASNRLDDTLRVDVPIDTYRKEKDIYLYNLATRSRYLERITYTPDADEHHPAEYAPKHYTYLGNQQGFDNRYLATIDSAITGIDTTIHYRYFTVTSALSSYQRDPLDYQYNSKTGSYLMQFARGLKPVIYLGNKDNDNALNTDNTYNPNELNGQAGGTNNQLQLSADTLETGEIDINNYLFEDERKDYSYEKESVRLQEIAPPATAAADSANAPFVLPRSKNYRLNFAADKVVAQFNNSFSNPFYQLLTGPSSVTPGLSTMTVVSATDLFEDYKIVGGFRLALRNNDYGASFENLKGRWDKKITLSRQSNFGQAGFMLYKIHTHNLMRQWKYPFTELSSLRIQAIVRHDRLVVLSNELTSLSTPNSYDLTAGLRLEYVFDNTSNKGLNLYNGTRYKFWAERFVEPDNLKNKTDLNVVGFDFRHYQRIHRDFIAAFRISGATTFGQYKIVHYLGGVDNWILGQKINNDTPIDFENQNYAYQSFVAPLRGFYVNSRNGNSVVMANSELRLPLFKYFMRKPIKSDFIENFQIVSFFDVGSAWTGKSPYADENTFNQNTLTKTPVTVSVSNNREPIIYGYGFGLRSRVLGYFIRADWAWGVDDNQVLPRVFYLSLNMDF